MTKNNGVATHVLSFPVILHVHVVFSTPAVICLCVGYRKLAMNLAAYSYSVGPAYQQYKRALLTVPALLLLDYWRCRTRWNDIYFSCDCYNMEVVGSWGLFSGIRSQKLMLGMRQSPDTRGTNNCVHSSDALCLQADGCTILGGIVTQVISTT